jgi:hypothetical protein
MFFRRTRYVPVGRGRRGELGMERLAFRGLRRAGREGKEEKGVLC